MSQFFKALEQAERDRLQQDQGEATTATPAARTTSREQEAPAAEPAVAERSVPRPPSPKPNVEKPSPKPTVEKPSPKPTVETRTVTKPAEPKPPAAQPVEAKAAVAQPADAADAKPAVVEPAEPKPAAAPAITRSAPPSRSEVPPPVRVFRPSLGRQHGRLLGRVNGQVPILVAQSDPTSIAAEAYRTVRANIELMSDNGAFRHLAITSAAGGDGKSTTAANLAVVAAQGGRRVCLIDADLRRPTLHDIFGLPNVDGLASAVQQGKPLHTVARLADIPNLSIVVAGRGVDESFRDVLTPQRLEHVLRESAAAYDLVLFDTPPIVSADALNVAAVCGGVILVVRAGTIPFSVLRRAIAQVTQVKGRVLGVLLNQVDLRTTDAGAYGYYRAYDAERSKS